MKPEAPNQLILSLISQGVSRRKARDILHNRGYASIRNKEYGLLQKKYRTGKIKRSRFSTKRGKKLSKRISKKKIKPKPKEKVKKPEKGMYYKVVITFKIWEKNQSPPPDVISFTDIYQYEFNRLLNSTQALKEYKTRILPNFREEMNTRDVIKYKILKVTFRRHYGERLWKK